MSVKDEVLKELENNKGDYISGTNLLTIWVSAVILSGRQLKHWKNQVTKSMPYQTRVIALQKKMIFYLHTVLNNI